MEEMSGRRDARRFGFTLSTTACAKFCSTFFGLVIDTEGDGPI
jgi:hypothetical protein